MKSVVSLLLAFGVIAPAAAFASVDAVSVSVSPNPADAGQSVTVSVEAQKSGGGCNNNWGYTKVFLDGVQIGTTTLNSYTGSGTTTDTFVFNAPSADALVAVEAWSGAEDFSPADGNPDCTDTLLGSDDVTLDVNAPAPASSSSSSNSSGSVTGGGGFTYCDMDTQPTSALRDIAMCLDRNGQIVNALQWRAGQTGGNMNAVKVSLMWKAVGLLNQMIEIVKASR